MISFRYHIVSIVSVFLALAVGVALGGGPLKGEVDNTLVEQVQADRRTKASLREQIVDLRAQTAFADDFTAASADQLVAGRLRDRSVTLLVLPGAPEPVVASVEELVGTAGGSVAGVVTVGERLVDVEERELVDELATQLLEDGIEVDLPEDASAYDRIAALLARAVTADRDQGAPVDQTAEEILAGLGVAELVSPRDELARRGSLVLVLGGARLGDGQDGAASIVTSLAQSLDAATDGVVVAAPTAATEDGGLVDEVRRDVAAAREVSTVDTVQRTAGQVAAVLALPEQARGGTGHYGAVDAAGGARPGAGEQD